MKKHDLKKNLKKFWHFVWEEDSIASWIVNIVLAFVLIKFIVYPGLGFVLGTSHPVVAVVSGSMEHNSNFDQWWEVRGQFYTDNFNMTKEQFSDFRFRNGFNKGDIMFLIGEDAADLEPGEVIVYSIARNSITNNDPIIHRVVRKWENDGYHFQTKGDNVGRVQGFESDIGEEAIIGKAVVRIPYLGWVKITFVCSINKLGGNQDFSECMLNR